MLFIISHLLLLIFFFVFNFCQFDVFLLGFTPSGTLCFLDVVDYFLSDVREVFSSYLFKYFLRSFLSFFSLWGPYNVNVGAFNVVPGLLSCLHFFILFSIFCSTAVISTILPSRSFIYSSASLILLLIPYNAV